jgi:hypothetical protein
MDEQAEGLLFVCDKGCGIFIFGGFGIKNHQIRQI